MKVNFEIKILRFFLLVSKKSVIFGTIGKGGLPLFTFSSKKGLFEVNFNGQKVNKFADLATYLQIIKCNINHGLYKSGVKKVLLIGS